MMPSAASAPVSLAPVPGSGSQPAWPSNARTPAAVSAKVEAIATTRRDAESAASSGTTTSQIAAKDDNPPVW